jgi:glycosyltransferase involved in cell wall biosynthesis
VITMSDQPDRVGVVHVVLSLEPGGTERLVVEMCRRLRSRFRVAVCTLDQPGTWAPELSDHGITVTTLSRRAGFHPSLGLHIARFARRERASILHCHQYSPFVYGRVATMLHPGLRLVFTEHGRLTDGPPSPKRRLVNPILGRLRGSLFAVSRALRQSMIEEGFPAHRLKVIHNGIDPGHPPDESARQLVRNRFGLPSGTTVIGTVARLDPIKDLKALIQAFAIVRQTVRDIELVIIGDGPERQSLEAFGRTQGLSDAIHFWGSRNEARTLLHAFDIHVNSSLFEGISLTILEAMAAGLPVVATRVGGTPEVVVNEVSGLLVPPRDAAALATAMLSLTLNPARRRALGRTARLAVERDFAIDRMVDDYAQEYLRVAS